MLLHLLTKGKNHIHNNTGTKNVDYCAQKHGTSSNPLTYFFTNKARFNAIIKR